MTIEAGLRTSDQAVYVLARQAARERGRGPSAGSLHPNSSAAVVWWRRPDDHEGKGGLKDDLAAEQKLVFALAHEIGNYLGAVRLEADLIDEELDARALAAASVSIDGLAARAGALLALLRPLSSPADPASCEVPWRGLLGSLQQQLEDEGTQGVVLEFGALPDATWRTPSVDWLGTLLLALLGATLVRLAEFRGRDRGAARGWLRVEFESRDGQAVLRIEDDGPAEDLGEGAALRGRPLVLAIARNLLARVGGRVLVERHADRTRVQFLVPAIAIA